MGVDVAVLLATLCLAALGWWRGFLGQVLGWVGLVAAWFATPVLAPWIRPVLTGRGFTAGSVAVASALLAFAVVLLLFRIAQARLPEAVGAWSLSAKRLDSGLGGVLGGLRGLALMWIVLSAFVLVEGSLLEREPGLKPHWQGSQAVGFARTYNPVAEMSLRRLAALRRALAEHAEVATAAGEAPEVDPGGAAKPDAPDTETPGVSGSAKGRKRRGRHPVSADALESPTAKARGRVRRPQGRRRLQDPALRDVARRKDWGALLADERVERLLQDDKALDHALRTLNAGAARRRP